MQRLLLRFFSTTLVTLLPTFVAAHGDEVHEITQVAATADAESITRALSFQTVGIASVIICVFVLLAVLIQKKSNVLKHLFFWPIVIATVVSTGFLGFMTVRLNLTSWSKGPIHWHADFEVWACNEELDLVDPKGWSNKVGSPSRHEHNDKRLHYEGVVMEPRDASLASFLNVIGGKVSPDTLTFPTNDGVKHWQNGDTCGDGQSGGVVNMFVYSVNADNTYSQRKITDPDSYIIRDDSQVPPGDCIIIEFGEEHDKTDRLCRSYRVAEEINKIGGEVPYGN